jgi:hypothetical protein
MNEPNTTDLSASLSRLADALERMDTQQSTLSTRVDRIVATIEENNIGARSESEETLAQLEARNAELVRANADLERTITELKAQTPGVHSIPAASAHAPSSAPRKTLSPLMTSLLVKNGVEPDATRMDASALEKSLASLSVEQRIAVKAEMARAGLID